MFTTLAIIAAGFVALCLLLLGQTKCRIPGPVPFPFFGLIWGINILKLHLYLFEWKKKYGDIVQFSIFGQRFVSLNTADLIRKVFSQEPNATITAARPPTFYGKHLLDDYSDVGFCSFSSHWNIRRKLFHKLLHAYGEGLDAIEKQMLLQLKHMRSDIAKLKGLPTDPHGIVRNFIFSNLEIILMGKESGVDSDMRRTIENMNTLVVEFANPTVDILYRTFPFLRWIPIPKSKRIELFFHYRDQMMKLLSETIVEDSCQEGFYYGLMKETRPSDENGAPRLTETHVTNILVDFVSAGVVTTTSTLMSAIHLLAKRPEVQKRLQKEIDHVIGDRQPRLSDRENLPYMAAFILETLRYIAHIPLAILHFTNTDWKVDEFHVPKHSIIIPNLWTVHHDQAWGDPFVFRPDRFLDSSGELVKVTDDARKRLLVFGHGKRSCIGEVFAKSRIFLFLVTLMQTCNIRESPTAPIPDLIPADMTEGLVLVPKPYTVVFDERQ